MIEIPRTEYAPTPDGGYIAYQAIGNGPSTVAFHAPFGGNVELWWEYEPAAGFWRELAGFARVILHDERGTGLSDAGHGLSNLETRAADTLAVLDAARVDRAVLFGAGVGGMVGAMCAASHPHRVDALIWFGALASVAGSPDDPLGATPDELAMISPSASDWGTVEGVRRMFGGELQHHQVDDAFVRWAAKRFRFGFGPATARELGRTLQESDVHAVLPSIRCPTLIIENEAFDERERALSANVVKLIPGARRVSLPGTSYMPWPEHEAFGEAIRGFLGVDRPEPVLDRALATVLFTDIVGSTEHVSAIGDHAWRDLLDRHDGIVRSNIDRFRGREISTAGDGFLATFDGPARAVFAATESAQEIRGRLGIQIRAGVHTGEIELEGADIRGLAVHIGARVAALAGPSQVMVSSTVKDLTAGSGLAFEDAGEHELKGVPDRWRLYRVR